MVRIRYTSRVRARCCAFLVKETEGVNSVGELNHRKAPGGFSEGIQELAYNLLKKCM